MKILQDFQISMKISARFPDFFEYLIIFLFISGIISSSLVM